MAESSSVGSTVNTTTRKVEALNSATSTETKRAEVMSISLPCTTTTATGWPVGPMMGAAANRCGFGNGSVAQTRLDGTPIVVTLPASALSRSGRQTAGG